jgi:hypothetical protein
MLDKFLKRGQSHPLVGKRIKMILMKDKYAVEPNEMGTINFVDDMGQIGVLWDNGRKLSVIPEEDEYEIMN